MQFAAEEMCEIAEENMIKEAKLNIFVYYYLSRLTAWATALNTWDRNMVG